MAEAVLEAPTDEAKALVAEAPVADGAAEAEADASCDHSCAWWCHVRFICCPSPLHAETH